MLVVAAVSLMCVFGCFLFFQQVSKQIVWFFFVFFFLFFFPCFFFLPLSLSPILLFLSLFPFFVDFPHNLFF